MHITAATTANIKIRPAMAIPMAKLRCDMQRASSGDCNVVGREKMLKKIFLIKRRVCQ